MTNSGTATAAQAAGKYLTFLLAGEEYGIEILKVSEIIGMLPITRVPRTPAVVRGVINLRGRVIPIVDLRRRFGLDSLDDTHATCIIVVQVRGVQLGVIVDSVLEVIDIPIEDMAETPSFGADVEIDYLLGIARSEGRVRLLLDIDRVLPAETAAASLASEGEVHAPASTPSAAAGRSVSA